MKEQGIMTRESAGDKGRKWLKINLQVPLRAVESVSDLLAVISGAGVEVRPPEGATSEVSAFFAVEPQDGGDAHAATAAILARVREEVGGMLALYDLPIPGLTHELLDDEDWATSWRQFFKPFEIVPGLVIRPSWESYRPAPDQQVLVMDPGMAFGTGQHASTRMALDLVADTCRTYRPAPVLDVGTGTGILAMGAALSGADRILAIDNDPEAVRVATATVRANRLQERIRVSAEDLAAVQGPFALICANIVHNVLVDMAPDFRRLLAPGGRIVLAGLLRGEQERNIGRIYSALGLRPVHSLQHEEWAALLLLDTSR